MLRKMERVEPAAFLVRLDEPQPFFILFAGRDDAAVEVVESAELHRMCKAFRASPSAVRSRMLVKGSGVFTSPSVTQ